MNARYDFEHISRFFDEYGEREWARLEESAEGRVSFRLHRRLLEQFVRAGDEVLEVGAGPGRFTIELARLGARVTVGGASRVQLGLNERKVREAGLEGSVSGRRVL